MQNNVPMGSLDELLKVYTVHFKCVVVPLSFNIIASIAFDLHTAGLYTLKKHDN